MESKARREYSTEELKQVIYNTHSLLAGGNTGGDEKLAPGDALNEPVLTDLSRTPLPNQRPWNQRNKLASCNAFPFTRSKS